jgi:hypothetical protein
MYYKSLLSASFNFSKAQNFCVLKLDLVMVKFALIGFIKNAETL